MDTYHKLTHTLVLAHCSVALPSLSHSFFISLFLPPSPPLSLSSPLLPLPLPLSPPPPLSLSHPLFYPSLSFLYTPHSHTDSVPTGIQRLLVGVTFSIIFSLCNQYYPISLLASDEFAVSTPYCILCIHVHNYTYILYMYAYCCNGRLCFVWLVWPGIDILRVGGGRSGDAK